LHIASCLAARTRIHRATPEAKHTLSFGAATLVFSIIYAMPRFTRCSAHEKQPHRPDRPLLLSALSAAARAQMRAVFSLPNPSSERGRIMTKRISIDSLAVRVCQTIRDVRRDDEAWISLHRVQDRLRIENLNTVDAAVAYAAAKGWLAIGGAPADSVLLNGDAP
jgi:hypothetical protein